MAVTIYDLAKDAGVGIATVSRCMNNHPNVSASTRKKILAIAKRLNYQPHAHAQRLASKKSNTISTIIPFFTNYFFIEILQGVQDKAVELGVDLILYGVNHPSQAEYYLRRSLSGGHVDGVMFFSMKFPESFVSKFQQINLPIVLVDTFHEKFDSIRVKNREGAMIATRHLLDLGHKNIAMINASLDTQPARDRLEGFRNALESYDIPFSMERVVVSGTGKQDGFNRESGFESIKEVILKSRGQNPVTAVFIASDVQAIGALEGVRELGVRVPDDLAIVSFDDIELAGHSGLTTMRQPMHQMGILALERLLERRSKNISELMVKSFMPELIVRQSCGWSKGHRSTIGRSAS